MDNYLNSFREMIELRGLASRTLVSYSTYIRSYLDYLQNVLKKNPENVSWQELRDYVKWLQNSRNLSDRTINCAIAQLRFFTIYVLHKPHSIIIFLSCLKITFDLPLMIIKMIFIFT